MLRLEPPIVLTNQMEPPPVLGAITKEPPPIMMEGDEGHSYFEKNVRMHVEQPGIGTAFIPTIGRYLEGDEGDMQLRPSIITGEFSK